MNEAIYTDQFSRDFLSQTHFLDFLHDTRERSGWTRQRAKDLSVLALDEDAPVTQLLRKQYELTEQTDLLDDTIQNTGLMLCADEQVTPIRSCAIKTILERARINGNALSRVSKPQLASILNYCLSVASGNALLWYAEGKISAVHAGDEKDYAVLEIPELFRMTVDYLAEHYPSYEFVGGTFDHSTVTALWELRDEPALVQTYFDALTRRGLLNGKLTTVRPVLRLTTSNTGISGANLYPMLFIGRAGNQIPLGTPLRVEHKNGATLEQFQENLERLYSQYDKGLAALTALMDIEIGYPANALLGVAKELGLPKRLALELADNTRTRCGDAPMSAHSLYYELCEAIFLLTRDGATGTKIAQMEEVVARALRVDWTRYDLPGDLNW